MVPWQWPKNIRQTYKLVVFSNILAETLTGWKQEAEEEESYETTHLCYKYESCPFLLKPGYITGLTLLF